MGSPRSGPCSPWCTGEQVLALPWIRAAAAKAVQSQQRSDAEVSELCAQAAAGASEIVYELSGRLFTGQCGPVTVRPVSRPTDADTRGLTTSVSTLGWFSSWGTSSGYGSSAPGVVAMYGSTQPPTIRLPWPVTSIVRVKIDGVVIPANEYELRDFQELVRLRTSASAVPTERWGWPTSQIMDLPDTQPGTFSVTFLYGTPPPAAGRLAAVKLAEYLALPALGDSTRYPQRTVQMSRQGVSTQVASVIDVLEKRSLGIWEVDAFLLAFNPKRNQRQAAVFSPDLGRPARTANPS